MMMMMTWLWQGQSPTFLLRSVFLAAESAHISRLQTLVFLNNLKLFQQIIAPPPAPFYVSQLPTGEGVSGNKQLREDIVQVPGIPNQDHFHQFLFCFSPFEGLALEILPQLFSRRYVSIVAEVVSNPKLVTHVISASQNLSKKADIINLLNVGDECTS